MTKELCINCDEETGRAGYYEDSLCPVLAGNYFLMLKGDTEGPLCEECYNAMDRLGLIDHEG